MKRVYLLLVIAASFASCKAQNDKQDVRNFLREHGISDYREIKWGVRDSVYSPFNAELSLSYFESKYSTKIMALEFERDYLRPASNEYKIVQDSLKYYKSELEKMRMAVAEQKSKKKKNREGITMKFVQYGDTVEWTFIFNNNGSGIGHVVKDGTVINL
uniref:Lipoprotein n=1 Tax=uncultured bacterium fosmid pJB83B9 TaxID=1478070 RepID=A0A0H3U9V8_9BACT|nr:hypothetical protein [uncultured bacterium fosmid pJB83B9]